MTKKNDKSNIDTKINNIIYSLLIFITMEQLLLFVILKIGDEDRFELVTVALLLYAVVPSKILEDISFFFLSKVSTYPSATVELFQPPCCFKVKMSLPVSANSDADVLRNA